MANKRWEKELFRQPFLHFPTKDVNQITAFGKPKELCLHFYGGWGLSCWRVFYVKCMLYSRFGVIVFRNE